MTRGNEKRFSGANAFPLVERYLGRRLDIDLSRISPGHTTIAESPRRLVRELSYGYIHAFWWIVLEDGRSAASTPPGGGDAVRAVIPDADPMRALRDEGLLGRLKSAVEPALARPGRPGIDNTFRQLLFACNGALVHMHHDGECVLLKDGRIPVAGGLRLPDHCFPDGIVYGVVADGTVVSVAYAHRSGPAGELVADFGVETAPAWRRKGYARTAVSHVVTDMAARGGEALYICAPENAASMATAASAGFVPWGRGLVLSCRGD